MRTSSVKIASDDTYTIEEHDFNCAKPTSERSLIKTAKLEKCIPATRTEFMALMSRRAECDCK